MKRELHGFRISVLRNILKELGYKGGNYHTGFPSAFDEWRKDGFHVKLTESQGRVTLHIHRDPEFHVGRTRFKGEDLEKEFKDIIGMYKKLRSTALSPTNYLEDFSGWNGRQKTSD